MPLFKNIYRTAISEMEKTTPGYKSSTMYKVLVEDILEMIDIMVNAEIAWTKYVSKDMLGFSDKAIELYVHKHANSVCSNLGITSPYQTTDGGPLMSIVNTYSMLVGDKKTNFFEAVVGDYSKGSLKIDF